jgi:SsrA-binding protein
LERKNEEDKMEFKKQVNIVNRKAKHDYYFTNMYEAGLQLTGTEVKSIRLNNANLTDAYCYFRNEELFVKNIYIADYINGTQNTHEPLRERKLLLKKQELKKIYKKKEEKGMTVIPYKLYFSDRGFVKLEIAVAEGKKQHDKRATIKDRDNKRELDRVKKIKL